MPAKIYLVKVLFLKSHRLIINTNNIITPVILESHISPVIYVACNRGRAYCHKPCTNPDFITFGKFILLLMENAQ